MPGVTYRLDDDQYVAIGEAARILGVSVSTVRRWRDEGRLASTTPHPGAWHRFRVGDLRGLMPADAEEPATELVWPHHYTHSDGSELCEWSGRPAESGQEECPSGHEHLPIAVSPLMPAVRAS